MSDADRQLHDRLRRALQDNPIRHADLLDARARHLQGFDDLIVSLENKLSDNALQSFEAELSESTAAAEAAKAARETFAGNSALEGLGTGTWKQLWESARRYSEALAYPNEPFPVVRENALCVLCQQPIARTAAQRLRGFEQFVQNDVQQRADRAFAKIQTRKAELEALRILLSGTLLRETGLRGTPEGQTAKAFIVAARLQRRSD